MAVSTVIMLAILSTVAVSPSLAASIGKQNRIRLVDGFTENEGVVEIQHVEMIKNAEVGVAWGTVCVPPHPSRNIGQVVCRQLGYEAFGYFLSVDQFTSLNYRRVALKVTKCSGDELSLETCQSMPFPTQLDCSQHQILAVMCAKNGTVRFESPSSSPQHSGQVEAFIGGRWRDVCPSHADSREHICSQLGYSAGMPGMPPPGRLHSSVSPGWDKSDKRCQDNMYGTEGCVWYQTTQGACRGINHQIECSGPPGKVAQPSVFAITGTSAIVNWMSVAERNALIANYTIIYWKRDGGRNNASNINTMSVPASPSDGLLEAELTGLTSDTVYSIEIAGVSEAQGPGEFSEPLTFKIPKELTRPPTLTDLNAVQLPGGAVDITYKIHSSRSSVKSVEAYFWTVAERETISSGRFVSSPINHQDKITLRGLLPSTNYTARLRVLSEINGLELVGNFSLVTFFADNTSFHPAPILSVKRVNISLVELSWTNVSGSLFRWSCYSNREHFKVEGVYSGQRNAILPHSDNTQSLTVIPGEHVYSIPIPLVNLEFNCSVAAEDREGLRNSEWSSAVRVEPLITSPSSIATVDTRVEGSTAFINWKAQPSSAQLPRQRRQSAQPAVKPLALSVNCTFPDVNQVREYFWWSPTEGERLTMESLPLGANGSCSATLYTHEGQGQSHIFPIRTETVPVEDLLSLRAPLVSGTNVTIEWVLPVNIIPKQTTVVVRSVSDVSAATEYEVQPHDARRMSLVLAQGEVYVCMVLVDVRGGGRLQSNPVQFRVPNAITTKLSSALGDAGMDGTTLTVHWSSIEDATGYVVMATSYIGEQRNETVTRVVFGPADATGNQELRVSIPFNIECSDKFNFKVAAFNSFGMGLYTDEEEVRPQETCDSFSSPSSSEAQGLVYGLLAALIVTVVILVCVGVAFFCLLQRNCAKTRDETRMSANGTLSAPRPRRSIRGSVRYIGVRVKKDEIQDEGKGEKEKELTSRPLPIPTESDVEEEEKEEEDQQRRSHIGSFRGVSPSASTQAPTDAGYATIPSDMRKSIIQSAHKTSMDHLKEQGYDVLHPTSAHYKSPRSLSPESPNVYNVPRGPSPVGEYELPVSSRSHSPAISQMKHTVRAQSAPHPLTYDVPPSRAAPAEVTSGQFGIPSARNHLYSNVSDMYDVPRNSQLMSASDSSGHVPAAYDVLPPRSSPNPNATYDIPKSPTPGSIPAQHQNGFMDSTYDKPSSIPAKAATPRLIPKTQAPDSTYDIPSSLPAKNENNYDVLPRSPHLSRSSGHTPSSAEDPPKVLTTPKQTRRFNLPSPEASPDMNSAHPTIVGFSSMPRPSQGKEGYYDVPPKRSAVVENGHPVQSVEGYYDTPRHHPVIVTPLTAGEECSTLQNGKSEEEESIPADASIGNIPSAESTPNSKHEHPYSKVKRVVSSDGKQQKVTVMEDWEGGLQDLEAAGVTSVIVSGSPHIARTLL